MAKQTDMMGIAAGVAALSISESLLLALNDLEIIDEKQTTGVLRDAADAHHGASKLALDSALHREVAAVIERIIAGENSIPRR